MDLLKNKLYQEDLDYITHLNLPWNKLKNSTVIISGASGLIASCLIDSIMKLNGGVQCRVISLGRNVDKAKQRFIDYWNNDLFEFISHDINEPIELDVGTVDYVLHMASNTHPLAYSSDPIGTVTTNIIGTKNMLDFAVEHKAQRFVFTSSCEVYGENRGDAELFDEKYCGYIDCNTMRAGYPESKRCGEALCQAYRKQRNLDVVIPRLSRSYGPTMLMSDTKALSQFIKKGIAKENIVLKSEGMQYYSYTYVTDAVAGLLTCMLEGEDGEAYNIADVPGDIRLKDLAGTIARLSGTKVVFELPDEKERAGYSTATKSRLDGAKIKKLGWSMHYDIEHGIERTLKMLREAEA